MSMLRIAKKPAGVLFWLGISRVLSFNAVGQPTTGTNAAGALSQLATAFSSGQIVHQVQLTGSAIWYAGSLKDTGAVTLTASTSGPAQMQLGLSSMGQRIESQSGVGEGTNCEWSKADGVAHQGDPGNCFRPDLWFLPALSLQPSLSPNYLGVADLGIGTVGFGTNPYRHLQSQFVFGDLPLAMASDLAQRSTSDLGLDSTTFLPAVPAYSVHPDNGAQTAVAIEIHYSNYQTVNGVQIPFLILRYVNGSLQLAITVSSAQAS